ncbi:MAG: hypothetical protein HRU15_12465, partial [Planctomycetes bacterium]|nr:hypothetical protein [Planctomycetota bacterium]
LDSLFESINARGWPAPETLTDLIENTQKLQAEASICWIEYFASLEQCWGIFLWNLADCWPQLSDAYIAYPCAVKPGLAAVRQAYAAIQR